MEFNLSEKIELMDVERGDRYHPMIDVKEVKEFIKRYEEELPWKNTAITQACLRKLKELVGKELSK